MVLPKVIMFAWRYKTKKCSVRDFTCLENKRFIQVMFFHSII